MNVTITAAEADIPAWKAVPSGAGPWPGVVVIHDLFGMTQDVKDQCEWLAAAGYLAVAPDLYSRGSKMSCVRQVFKDLSRRSGPAFDDVEVTRAWMATSDDCTGRIGVIGFCMGGGFALLLAPDHGFDAASVNYGAVPDDAETLLAGACPVVGSYGERDRGLKGAAVKLRQALDANGVENDVEEYPSVGHSFMNDHEGRPAMFMKVFGPMMGGGYDEATTLKARSRIEAFFGRHLQQA